MGWQNWRRGVVVYMGVLCSGGHVHLIQCAAARVLRDLALLSPVFALLDAHGHVRVADERGVSMCFQFLSIFWKNNSSVDFISNCGSLIALGT